MFSAQFAAPLLAAFDFSGLSTFLWGVLAVAAGMLIWDTIEVGRNDAANLVNAVFGARVLRRRAAVAVAAVGVILGAAASSNVMETARKGIFDPAALVQHATDAEDALALALSVYVAVYIVDTVLLYGYSAFGMPVSTTACLVFELLGASLALGGPSVVKWEKAGTVVFAIVCSILISGIAAFIVQRALRGAVRERTDNLRVLLAHGGWIGGGFMAVLTYFMLVKGMKGMPIVQTLNKEIVQAYGSAVVILTLWAGFGILIHACLVIFKSRAAQVLFPALTILGTLAMAFAFGQNDLANCASPGLAAIHLIQHRAEGVAGATKIEISGYALIGCGVLLALGMFTRNAQRVTLAAVHAGSMSHSVRLWAPVWCIALARALLRWRRHEPSLAPPPGVDDRGKRLHYDALRACVILGVSACVIATASSFGLPVSTTYVSFAAVIATGMADRILARGDADLKLARTIWVVFSWFASAAIAAVFAGVVCRVVYGGGLLGIGVAIGANLLVRWMLGKRADAQEVRVREQTRERREPDLYADYEDA